MLRSYLYRIVFLSFLSVQSTSFAAPLASIRGKVTDAETGEGLPGVTIVLVELNAGAKSDVDGYYQLRSIPAGGYSLRVSMIGYAQQIVNDIDVQPDKQKTVNITMESVAILQKEIEVEARKVYNTESALINIQRNSSAISDGISDEQIKKSPDRDAGGAVKRIAGVTVVGDKYVFVRGLGERYNNTRLNGLSIASPEPLKRTVPFDIIPSNFLQNVIVSKSFTPDQPGDFAGGSIQLKTNDFPDNRLISASVSQSFNSLTSLKNFYTYQGGSTDEFAFDDGTRKLPSLVKNVTGHNYDWMTNDTLQRDLAMSFKDVWTPRLTNAPLNGNQSISIGDQFNIGEMPFGYLVSINHGSNFQRKQEQQSIYTGNGEKARFDVDQSIASYSLGGLLDLSMKVTTSSKIGLKTFYSRSADDVVRTYQGFNFDENSAYRGYRLQWTERALLSNQLLGVHELPFLNSRLEWNGAYSQATFYQPDRRDVVFAQADTTWHVLIVNDSPFRRYGNMQDYSREGSLDWTIPLTLLSSGSKLKTGGAYRYMNRNFETRKFYFENVRQPGQPYIDYSLPPDEVFSARNIYDQFRLKEVTTALDPYRAHMAVTAGYVMADANLGNLWRLVGGVRVERTVQKYQTYSIAGTTASSTASGGPEHTDVLPSLGATYRISPEMNLRASISRTIANPDYAELIPTSDQDYYNTASKEGNPNLNYTKISNYDLHWDWYTGMGETVGAGTFYKKIVDPIELVQVNASEIVVRPDNFGTVDNYGFELEFRKSLEPLSRYTGNWIRDFSIIGNYAYISSNIKLDNRPSSAILTSKKRPMMGQSPYVINGTLSYEQHDWGSNVRVLFNTFGKRLVQVGSYGAADTYEESSDKLDVYFDQKLGANFIMKLQASNILDPVIRQTAGGKNFNNYKAGKTYGLSVSYVLQ